MRAQLLAAMTAMDLTPGLEALRGVPVTVVVGQEDRQTPLEQAMRMVSALPHARLVVEPDAGHMLPFEAPDLLARLLTEAVTGAGSPFPAPVDQPPDPVDQPPDPVDQPPAEGEQTETYERHERTVS